MPKFRYFFPLFLSLCLTSCAPLVFLGGAAAGVGSYKYMKDVLTVVYEAPFDNTYEASVKALKELGFSIESQTKELGSGKIVTKEDANNKEVRLAIQYKSVKETEVTIRVGLLGDEAASNIIKDKIQGILF